MAQFDLLTHVAESTLVVQAAYLLLLGMSLGSWAAIFWKILQYRRAGRQIRSDLLAFRRAARLPEAVQAVGREKDSPSLAVVREAVHEYKQLEKLEATPGEVARIILENVRWGLRDEQAAQTSRLGISLNFLVMCASAAPLLGLFGTVWGIFHSFQGFAELTPGSLQLVGRGLAEALGTTIGGMLVAIPAAIGHNMLAGWLADLDAALGDLGTRFLFLLRQELGSQPKEDPATAIAADAGRSGPGMEKSRRLFFRLPGMARAARNPDDFPE
ncbi:MAG: MotA/TolQ/ExbB proton channel family protein [Desulfovibrio sp.]|nr:MotA/TolQ/ExbB proton channel family protein [Desulfovibrio sp.]MCA1985574.1 MotA/TolQ/ExbB proton channel family protein [Desulfovibrio sp.]